MTEKSKIKNPKTIESTQFKFPSELRYDVVSKDWVVIATGRARRPELFKKERRLKDELPQKLCPFCRIETQERPVLIYSHGKEISRIPHGGKIGGRRPTQETEGVLGGGRGISDWTTIVIPNKYPAFSPFPRLNERTEGRLYRTINAVGFHEVVVTRDHRKSIAKFKTEQVKELMDAYHQRYLDLMKEKFVNYVSIFHNHGVEAGATLSHPHSQIITTPLIDTDLRQALSNAKKYFSKTRKCVYCVMNEWEKKSKERVVFENKEFRAICPFASKSAFEVIISPKKHLPYFEKITEREKWQLAEAFQVSLNKLYKALNDPAYNFYLHTSPCDGQKYPSYHWHWTILPKTSTWAGFEIGTRMEISTIEPEKAAEYLRKQ